MARQQEIGSFSVNSLAPLATVNRDINITGLLANETVQMLWLRVRASLTRGAGSLTWPPEVLLAILDEVQIRQANLIDFKCSGLDIALVEHVRGAGRINVNPELNLADTAIEIYIPISLEPLTVPILEKAYRIPSNMLNGVNVKMRLKNPFAVGDVDAITSMECALIAQYSETAGGSIQEKAEGAFFFQSFSDFSGNVRTFTDYQKLFFLALEGRETFGAATNWQGVTGTAGQKTLYTNVYSDQLDMVDYRHQERRHRLGDMATRGDDAFIQRPEIDSTGAAASVDYTSLFTSWAYKNAKPPYSFNFTRLNTNALRHIVQAWQ